MAEIAVEDRPNDDSESEVRETPVFADLVSEEHLVNESNISWTRDYCQDDDSKIAWAGRYSFE